MGQKTYYHNLTKGWFNENDYGDAVENSDVGDIIKMSFRGNALIIDLLKEDLSIEDKKEHDWARKQFLEYFEEFHGVPFVGDNLPTKDYFSVIIQIRQEKRNELSQRVPNVYKM